ncbi:unnamed protein product, partial [Ectocarpus sp. 12 AP-2014]
SVCVRQADGKCRRMTCTPTMVGSRIAHLKRSKVGSWQSNCAVSTVRIHRRSAMVGNWLQYMLLLLLLLLFLTLALKSTKNGESVVSKPGTNDAAGKQNENRVQ